MGSNCTEPNHQKLLNCSVGSNCTKPNCPTAGTTARGQTALNLTAQRWNCSTGSNCTQPNCPKAELHIGSNCTQPNCPTAGTAAQNQTALNLTAQRLELQHRVKLGLLHVSSLVHALPPNRHVATLPLRRHTRKHRHLHIGVNRH